MPGLVPWSEAVRPSLRWGRLALRYRSLGCGWPAAGRSTTGVSWADRVGTVCPPTRTAIRSEWAAGSAAGHRPEGGPGPLPRCEAGAARGDRHRCRGLDAAWRRRTRTLATVSRAQDRRWTIGLDDFAAALAGGAGRGRRVARLLRRIARRRKLRFAPDFVGPSWVHNLSPRQYAPGVSVRQNLASCRDFAGPDRTPRTRESARSALVMMGSGFESPVGSSRSGLLRSPSRPLATPRCSSRR